MTPWFLYLIRTADNKLYTGITTDVERRYQQHQSGKGAKALRGKGELTLAFPRQWATVHWHYGRNIALSN